MAGILDLFTQPAGSFYGGLLNTGDNTPNYAGLNPDAGDTDALATALKGKNDPFEDLDKKQKEDVAKEAAKQAALGVFATGAPPVPQAGVSGQQVMQPGPFGSLAPMAPQQPVASPAAPPVAQGPVPIPQPRPAASPAVPPAAPQQDQAAIPPNAQPTQGQLPPQQAAPQPQEPSFLSKIGDKLNQNSNLLIGMGAGFAGAPSIGTGISRGLTGAEAGSQIDTKQNMLGTSQSAMYRAFMDAKVPPKLAIAALYDPEIRKSVTENYLSDRKGELKDITLANGTKMSVLHNPYTNSVTDLQGKPIDLGNLPGAIDPRLTGDDAYQAAVTANPKLAAKALALKEGREVWPVGRAVTAGDNQQAMDLARQMDPTLTEANATLRHQTITDYGPKGKTGYARTAASTLLGHADQYDKLIDQQGNNDVGGPIGNEVRDYIKTTMGTDKKYLDTKGAMGELRTGIANEMEKALAGRVSVQGIKDILAPLDQAKGPTEQHAAIKGIIHMLGTRLDEMSNNFDTSMNTQTQGFHMLSPKAREIFKRYGGQVTGDDTPSSVPGVKDPGVIQDAAPPAAGLPAGWSVKVH
jgi:hypothetical protein